MPTTEGFEGLELGLPRLVHTLDGEAIEAIGVEFDERSKIRRFSVQAYDVLNKEYKKKHACGPPHSSNCLAIAKHAGIEPRQVYKWFDNQNSRGKRRRGRKQQKSHDSSSGDQENGHQHNISRSFLLKQNQPLQAVILNAATVKSLQGTSACCRMAVHR